MARARDVGTIDQGACGRRGEPRGARAPRVGARPALARRTARFSSSCHIEERPVAEAAELLGWSVVNVKVRAYRSRKKLRAILERLIAKEGGDT